MEQTNSEKQSTKMDLEIDNWKNLSYGQKLEWQRSNPLDCSFVVGEGVNTRTIGAHKCVLISASEIFRSMFNGNYKEADASFNIRLPNVVNYVDFKVMLAYIYCTKTDSIKFLNLERIKHVSYLADYYLLDPLLNACHSEIERIVTRNNTSFYDFLQVYEYEKKVGRKINTFTANDKTYFYEDINKTFPYKPEVLMTNTSIYDLEPRYFYDLLIVLASTFKESVRFCMIENYAKIHGLKMNNCLFNNSERNSLAENLKAPTNRKSLNEMFELINFRKMTSSEFTDGPAVSKVWALTHEEKLFSILGTKNVEKNELEQSSTSRGYFPTGVYSITSPVYFPTPPVYSCTPAGYSPNSPEYSPVLPEFFRPIG